MPNYVINAYSTSKFLCISLMSGCGGLIFLDPDVEPIYMEPNISDKLLGENLRQLTSHFREVSVEELKKIGYSGSINSSFNKRTTWQMKHYKYKNKRELYKDRNYCKLEFIFTQSRIVIIPTSRKGVLDKFSILKDQEVELPITVSDEELGAGLREGFLRCRP